MSIGAPPDLVNDVLQAPLAGGNAFIEFQKTGEGEDPLATVPLPKIVISGTYPEQRAINAIFAGDADGAIKIANAEFATAPQGEKLNKATELMARCLRNKDGNPKKRADAYAKAINDGKPFADLPELKNK